MKKLLSAVLALTMMFAMVGCGASNNTNGNNAGNNTNMSQNADTNANTDGDANTDGEENTNNGGEENNGAQTENMAAPDLTKYYEDFMGTLGEENTPMMMPADPDTLTAFYAGLSDIPTKQCVVQLAAMSAVAFEFALVECENAEDVEAVKAIFEARKAYQVDGGAWYPETVAAWEGAEIVVQGNIVALILAGEATADAFAAFNGLFAQTW